MISVGRTFDPFAHFCTGFPLSPSLSPKGARGLRGLNARERSSLSPRPLGGEGEGEALSKLFCASLLILCALFATTTHAALPDDETQAIQNFDIWEFQIEGNTMLPGEDVERAVYGHLGEGKTIADVNQAQQQLETLYHERGFGSVFVDIPEQDVQNGVVLLTPGRMLTKACVSRLKRSGPLGDAAMFGR